MKNAVRAALTAALLFIAGPALAQNIPANSIQGRLSIPAGGGPVQSIPITVLAQQIFINVPAPLVANLDIVGNLTTRRTTATDVGGTFTLGHGASAWQVITNNFSGFDFSIVNPSGQTVLYMPQSGVNVQVGQGVGLSRFYVYGSQFVASQGPLMIFQGGSQTIAQLGADCAILGTPCNTDFFIVGPASSRSANFYQWASVRVITTSIPNPTQYVGGALAIITDSANTFAGGNGITSQINLTTPGSFPTAVTALVNATTGGSPGTAWGLFAECDLHVAIECAAVEATVGNKAGAPNVPPVSTVPNPTQPYPVALKATCGGQITPVAAGTSGCSVGLWIHYYNGNGGWPFLNGIYMTEGVATTCGICIQATSTLSPTTTAKFMNSGTGKALILQQMDAGTPTGHIMEVRNSSNSITFAIDNNGTLDAPVVQGGTLNALAALSLVNSGFNQSFLSGGTLTGNHGLTVNLNNTDTTLTMNGNVNFNSSFLLSGAFSTTITVTGTTSVTFPTSGTLATLTASGGFAVGTASDPGAGNIYVNAGLYLIRNKTTIANGAAASSGTLTNAPAAGNPTKWIAIDDNGTTRYFPAW